MKDVCDICLRDGKKVNAEYDGKKKMGPWGFMCSECFHMFGIGLGKGNKMDKKLWMRNATTFMDACDVCNHHQAIYDAKLKVGPWANVCETCFQKHGIGLGLGKGQKINQGDKKC